MHRETHNGFKCSTLYENFDAGTLNFWRLARTTSKIILNGVSAAEFLQDIYLCYSITFRAIVFTAKVEQALTPALNLIDLLLF